MEILQAILLGIVEGLTEFLPISSTGHLVVGADLLNYKDTAEIFTVVIQMGAIAAVIWFYRQDLISKVIGLFRRDPTVVRFWNLWIVAVLPAALVGFVLKDQLSEIAVIGTVAVSLVVGGLLILLIENYYPPKRNTSGQANLENISATQAIKVGLYQILALVPGVSRSGATIMGGVLSGLDRVTATAFSFYLSIPIILLAGGYQLLSGRDKFDTISGGVPALLVGTLSAFVVALITIKWLLRYVARHDFKLFAYYRIALGLVILIVLLFT